MTSLLTVVSAVALPWLGMNLLHGLWVGVRRRVWERRFARRPDGLLPDAAPFRLGNGSAALLFIHGFADTPRLWRRAAERLAANRAVTCRAMRLPGCAEPPATAGRASLPLWRAQVDGELARLRKTHGTVWVVGHSLGGALALDAALRLPGQVDGVAVMAPLIAVSRKRCPLLPPGAGFAVARRVLGLSPVFESPFSTAIVAEDDPSFTYLRDRFIPFSAYAALFQLVRANRGRAADLACPVFAVLAGRDSVVDSAAARRWLAACPGPKDIRERPEAGHVIPLASGWEGVFDDLVGFMRSHGEAGGGREAPPAVRVGGRFLAREDARTRPRVNARAGTG
ncbi:MAG: alpha/beta fold hydrolase [Verrucomicrobiota bacterium]|jgi:pimeloyl-ACP methyl ester carboxylesterase|nr:alpha/beta fold hydrolase [Verrucomicrobiota bacterium]